MDAIKRVALFLILFDIAVGSFAQVRLEDKVSVLSPGFIGFNGRSTEGPSWDDPKFVELVREMNPASFRYPAGSQANLWDWRTGNFIPESGKKTSFPFTLNQCVAGLPAGTQLIYVVNMAYPTPVTGISMRAEDAILASDVTLKLKIEDILAAIDAFEKAGHRPDQIELGNEFYFKNEHAGVYGKNPKLYLTHAKQIAATIKRHYPEMPVMVVATKNGTKGRDEWNNAVYAALETDEDLSLLIDGVVQHHYVKEDYGMTEPVSDLNSLKRAVAEGWTYVTEQESSIAGVPAHMKLWLTEYGATKKNMDGTWGAALRAVVMTLGWMRHPEKIASVCWQHVTDDPNVIRKSTLQKGPVGVALGMMMNASKGMTQMRKLLFSNNQSLLPDSYIPALHGVLFGNESGKKELILVNLEETATEPFDLSSLFENSLLQEGISYSAEQPYLADASLDAGIVAEPITLLTQIVLKPFSVTRLSFASGATMIQQNPAVNDKNLLFDPAIGMLRVLQPGALSVFGSSGQIVYSANIQTSQWVDLSALASGFYYVRLRKKNGSDDVIRIALIL